MENKCPYCGHPYIKHSIINKEDNVVSKYDRYGRLIYVKGKKYIGITCEVCGTIIIE